MTDYRYYVYLHRRADNGEVFYVGSSGERISTNPSRPYKRGRDLRPRRRTAPWRCAADEAGGVEWEILSEHASDEECRRAELDAIERFNTKWLVNHQRKSTAVWHEERRALYSRPGEAHPNFGKKLPREVCLKKSEALRGDGHHLKGKKLPKEWRDNLAAAKVGNKNPMYGKTGAQHHNSKAVLNSETGAVYGSVAEAARAEGITAKALYQYLDGTRRNPTPLQRAS